MDWDKFDSVSKRNVSAGALIRAIVFSERNISVTVIEKISTALGLSISQLFENL